MIQWELCKILKFDQIKKWYMHKSESVREKETYKILWNFEIQTDYLIPTRKTDKVLISKKDNKKKLVDFAVLTD